MKFIDINPLFNELTSKEAAAISGGTSGTVVACIKAPCPMAEPDFEEILKSFAQNYRS